MPFLGSQPAETALTTGNLGDDIVTEAKMANDAISLTELKAGTDGEIISWDASGNPVAVGAGTSGHFLKSQGAGSQPVFAAAGGAWNLIGTVVASDDATLTITGLDSTYDTYAIGLSDLVPASDGVGAWLRLGDSGGIDSGASDYAFFCHGAQANDTTFSHVGDEDNAEARIELVDTANLNVGNASGEGFGGMLHLHRPGDGTSRPTVTGSVSFMQTNSTLAGDTVFGMRAAVITLDRVQFLFSSGNVSTGRMTVWGIAHA